MALTAPQFQTWLQDNSAIRCILVEVIVNIGGTETTLYLSNRNYSTGPSDTPANTVYQPIIQTSLNFNQSLSIDGTASLSYGDIAIDNTNGERDSWLSYIWANRAITIYIGDVRFNRTEFTKIYSGYVSDIASSDRNTLNISIRDILQRLNTPITSAVIGGVGQNKEVLKPLVFGEVYNITPVLIDPVNLIYMVHNGPIESIIEVRDNGAPLTVGTAYTVNLANGTFTLLKSPVGDITCSVQGERTTIDPLTGSLVTGSYVTGYLTWSKTNDGLITITHTNHGMSDSMSINVVASSNTTELPLGIYNITYINANSYSIFYQSAANLLAYTEQLDNASWAFGANGGTGTVTPNDAAAPAPYTSTAEKITSTTGGYGRGYKVTLVAGISYTFSIKIYTTALSVNVDFSTAQGTGGVVATTSVPATASWQTASVSYTPTTSGTYYVRASCSATGQSFWATQAQMNTGTSALTYSIVAAPITVTGTNTISTYANTVARIIQVILSKYGTLTLNASDMDLTAINTFNSANLAPVGIYLTTNTNVINACQELANSIGAQFTSNRTGLVTLLKINTPTAGTTSITDIDIIQGSCSIDQKLPVQGAIKLGYCRNWTVQGSLLTGIPDLHKNMFAVEYITVKVTDSTVLTNYNLSSEPEIKYTSMLTDTPITYVTNEANRLLTLWKTPRFVYKMECTAKLLTVNIGDMVQLTHYRFGLSSTKNGQVIAVSTNWDTGRVTLGILV